MFSSAESDHQRELDAKSDIIIVINMWNYLQVSIRMALSMSFCSIFQSTCRSNVSVQLVLQVSMKSIIIIKWTVREWSSYWSIDKALFFH